MVSVRCVTTDEIFDSIVEASQKYGISQGNISKCCQGKLKSTGRIKSKNSKRVMRLKWEYYIVNNGAISMTNSWKKKV